MILYAIIKISALYVIIKISTSQELLSILLPMPMSVQRVATHL